MLTYLLYESLKAEHPEARKRREQHHIARMEAKWAKEAAKASKPLRLHAAKRAKRLRGLVLRSS